MSSLYLKKRVVRVKVEVMALGKIADLDRALEMLGAEGRYELHAARAALPAENHGAGVACERRPGADAVLERLAEMMFVDTARRYLDDLPEDATGWLAGLRDRHAGDKRPRPEDAVPYRCRQHTAAPSGHSTPHRYVCCRTVLFTIPA